jgi:iron(III) transport system ATP-binding protein
MAAAMDIANPTAERPGPAEAKEVAAPGISTAKAMVSVRGLVKRFEAGSVAVQGVSFDIRRGEVLTLLGPSGCGKTTIMRCIAGFEQPSGGEIYIDDRLVSDGKRGAIVPVENRGIGFVHQSYALWPHKSVFDTLAFGLRNRKTSADEIERRVTETLGTVKLDGLGDRFPAQLSGGQQQRVALGRSLVYNPDIILLDEPLSNLDAKLREYTREELRRLFKRLGSTVLYVTHDQAEAMAISDTCIVLNQGSVQQSGDPRGLYTRPRNAFVAEFMGSCNVFSGSVASPNLFRTAWGDLRMDTRSDARPAAPSRFCIRPKDIRISLERPQATNIVPARVMLTAFVGEHVKYTLAPEAAAPAEIVVHVHNYNEVHAREGDAVYLTFPEAACIVLDE